MRKRMLVAAILLIPVLLTGCGGGGGSSGDEKAIHNLLNTISTAMKTQDASRFDRILADELTVIDDEGSTNISKENQIAVFRLGMLLVVSVSKYEFEERNITINEDTAVIECQADVDMQTVFGPSIGSGPATFEARKFSNGWKLTVIDQGRVQYQ